jgi:hypothetical protein
MRASRDELAEVLGPAVRAADWGDLRSIAISLPSGTDLAPLLQGLPDNLCSCPHWGYVIKGRMRVSSADGDEVLRAGDLYYLPPGHTGVVEEDFEAIEFSPPGPHEQVLDVVKGNAAMAQSAPA